ncbi:hypothetical protein Tco_0907245 [Tanacetum coccineum]|uniref:Uncharacterized protein n=1 Tax=Tanacetum coccineum TaxID=301880 RepID=A0ABQ5CIV7_9ASTR
MKISMDPLEETEVELFSLCLSLDTICSSIVTGGRIIMLPLRSLPVLIFCYFHEEQCSTDCDHCSLSNIPSSLPTFHNSSSSNTEIRPFTAGNSSVVATENTGSDVVGMENEDSDGDGTVNGGMGYGEVIVKV